MAIAWYAVKVWLLTSPDASERVIATRPMHSYTWENWTVTKDNGTTVTVPQRVRRKYQGFPMSPIYNREYDGVNESSIPTVAVLRVEHPDGTDPPLEAVDFEALLNTTAKWNALFAQYPEFVPLFPDGIPI